ncbi:hypothetical protein DIPPA_17243 [Diplonema papillatum]|nr:hypothetical protein DIPPA_17243 [Diplonema papillatum]
MPTTIRSPPEDSALPRNLYRRTTAAPAPMPAPPTCWISTGAASSNSPRMATARTAAAGWNCAARTSMETKPGPAGPWLSPPIAKTTIRCDGAPGDPASILPEASQSQLRPWYAAHGARSHDALCDHINPCGRSPADSHTTTISSPAGLPVARRSKPASSSPPGATTAGCVPPPPASSKRPRTWIAGTSTAGVNLSPEKVTSAPSAPTASRRGVKNKNTSTAPPPPPPPESNSPARSQAATATPRRVSGGHAADDAASPLVPQRSCESSGSGPSAAIGTSTLRAPEGSPVRLTRYCTRTGVAA